MEQFMEELEIMEDVNEWDDYEEVDFDEYRESYSDYICSYIY